MVKGGTDKVEEEVEPELLVITETTLQTVVVMVMEVLVQQIRLLEQV